MSAPLAENYGIGISLESNLIVADAGIDDCFSLHFNGIVTLASVKSGVFEIIALDMNFISFIRTVDYVFSSFIKRTAWTYCPIIQIFDYLAVVG
jgi:hypothetical protein